MATVVCFACVNSRLYVICLSFKSMEKSTRDNNHGFKYTANNNRLARNFNPILHESAKDVKDVQTWCWCLSRDLTYDDDDDKTLIFLTQISSRFHRWIKVSAVCSLQTHTTRANGLSLSTFAVLAGKLVVVVSFNHDYDHDHTSTTIIILLSRARVTQPRAWIGKPRPLSQLSSSFGIISKNWNFRAI